MPRRAMRGVMDRSRHAGRGTGGGRRPCPRGACGGGIGGGARLGRRPGQQPASCCRGGWRRSARSRAACPGHRRGDGAWFPGRPRSVGFGPIFVAGDERPFCGDRGAVDRRPAPIELVRRGQPLEERPVQIAQHARRMPVPQPTPAGHARTAEALARQHRPRNARAQHEHDALERPSVVAARTPALRLRRLRGQQRRDRRPQLVAHKRSGHGPQRRTPRWVLLGALSPTSQPLASSTRDSALAKRPSRQELPPSASYGVRCRRFAHKAL